MTLNPDGTPIVPPVIPPAEETVPAWAQSLIDQNADITDRLSSFEEKLTPPEPVAPAEPEHPEVWTPKSWEDVDARAEEKAKSIVEANFAEREQATKAANDQQTAAANEIDQMLDNQVAELTKGNKLPAVVNEDDANDPGKLAQRELYGFALSLGTADLTKSYGVLDSLHKAGKQFDFVKMELVDKNPSGAGAYSPVASSSAGGAGAATTRPDYATLHNSSLDQLAARFGE